MKILLEQYRKRRRLSQEQLANLSGVSQPMISMIETGSVPNPTISTVYRLASALKCMVEDLIEVENTKGA